MVITIGTLFGTALRFVAHFISGLVWWRAFAPEGTPVWIYSLVYNAGYLIPSFILTAVVLVLLIVAAPRLVKARMA
ncbi:MAG TPA: energy-coupled thiamine transporter ThiT, partial [Bacillales bacterium]|nr:energy-coupled thiamine transporter ThiT [Bacillales bacterium]